MARRTFPAVYVTDVQRSAEFYARLGFREESRFPSGGEPGYVGLRLDDSRLGLVDASWPEAQIGVTVGTGARFELCVYVEDPASVDALVEQLRADGVEVLQEPADMPWNERQAYIADPDGNPIALTADL
jgi:lactoylglutathione lyase